MTGLELLEKYPKASKIIAEFYHAKLIASMDTEEVTEEFKEMLKQQSFDNEYFATFIDGNPRFLFDVFDENDINIIIHVYTEEKPTEFAFSIAQHDYDHDELYPTRKEAEAVAVEKAFEILNNKL